MNNSKRSRLGQAFVNAFSMMEYGKLRAAAVDALAKKDVQLVLQAAALCEKYEDLLEGTVAPGQA